MIKLFWFWIKDRFTKPKPKNYIHLIKQLEGKYLCVINGRVYSITKKQYEEYLKKQSDGLFN